MGKARAESTQLELPLTPGPVPVPPENPRVAAAALILLILGAMMPASLGVRAAVVSGMLVFLGARVWLRWRAAGAPRGWVIVDDEQILRVDGGGRATIVRWDAPFGLTVLVNQARTQALLAFTTTEQARYLRVRLAEGEPLSARQELVARAITVADGDLDLALGARGDTLTESHGGKGPVVPGRAPLGAESALSLLAEVGRRAGAAFDRVYTSDSRGAGILLDAASLRVGEKTIDLLTPLEWRTFVFQDGPSSTAAAYQATWVRQGGAELVLVCPASGPRSSDTPPSRELRIAVDRLFMPAIRQALARAPRISRAGVPSHGGPHAVPT